jgi:hypothetical protein
VLSEVKRVSGDGRWGVTWPVLEFDGMPLEPRYQNGIARTTYGTGDEEAFIAVGGGAALRHDVPVIRSTYGDLRPVLVEATAEAHRTFVYPRASSDPSVDEVRKSWKTTSDGFSSSAGTLRGKVWVGRTAAGGWGAVDLDGDGKPELRLSAPCNFVIQLSGGRVIAAEADRAVQLTLGTRKFSLNRYQPLEIR